MSDAAGEHPWKVARGLHKPVDSMMKLDRNPVIFLCYAKHWKAMEGGDVTCPLMSGISVICSTF